MAADSWGLVVEEIHRLAPDLTVLALDMPGRRNKPGDLREMNIADYVESLAGDIESAGLNEIVKFTGLLYRRDSAAPHVNLGDG
jgi:surfactin synthase thioesterase subunit